MNPTDTIENSRFDNLSYVTLDNIDNIVSDFIEHVLVDNDIVDIDTISGIGSTRLMLDSPTKAKDSSNDIDLIAVSTIDSRDSVTKLQQIIENKGISSHVSFGSIVSVAYPYQGKHYQIDLMLANSSSDNTIYSYMTMFKYWSNECGHANNTLQIKGAHRSELLKTLTKAVGLSAAENGFKEFIWNDTYLTTQDLSETLLKKVKKFRSAEKISQTTDVVNYLLDNDISMSDVRNQLCDDAGTLKTRYPHSVYKNLPYAYDVLIDLLFNKVDTVVDWVQTLKNKFDIKDVIGAIDTFDTSLKLTHESLDKGIVTELDVINMLNDIKKRVAHRRAKIIWTDEFESFMISEFPFLIFN